MVKPFFASLYARFASSSMNSTVCFFESPVFSASVAIVCDFVIEATLPILHISPYGRISAALCTSAGHYVGAAPHPGGETPPPPPGGQEAEPPPPPGPRG